MEEFMNQVTCLLRLAAMRRRAGAGVLQSIAWAAGLLLRNRQTGTRRQHLERRAEVERAARQRL